MRLYIVLELGKFLLRSYRVYCDELYNKELGTEATQSLIVVWPQCPGG